MTRGWLGHELVRLGSVGSTNDEAITRARAGAAHGTVVVAEAQTRGRGRQGHRWYSPPGENLYLSALLRPDLPPPRVPPITLAAGVAACDVARALGADATLKWPNDVLAGGRKLCGVLTELGTRDSALDYVVVGLGFNVNGMSFPGELEPIATSLRRERARAVSAAVPTMTVAPLDMDKVLASLLVELERWLDVFLTQGPAPIASAWRTRAAILGRRVRVTVDARTIEGTARDVDDEGALWLDTDDGKRFRVVSGEVTDA